MSTSPQTPQNDPRAMGTSGLCDPADTPQPQGMGSWFCLVCDSSGQSVKFDLEARKHTETTTHATTTSHRDPVPLKQCIDEFRVQLEAKRRG